MSKGLKTAFLVHAEVAFVLGAPLLIAPGRVLTWLGWAPIDPIASRVLGAALLALAWSSFRGWRATERARVAILLEMEAAFTVLGCVGLLRHLLFAHYPVVPWLMFAILLVFALAWIWFLVRRE
jgi:hypothetical protein